MDPSLAYADLLDALSDLVPEFTRQLPYAAFSLVHEDTHRVWTSGSRSGFTAPLPETGLVLRLWDGERFHEFGTNEVDVASVRIWARDRAQGVKPVSRGGELPSRPPVHQAFSALGKEDFRGVSVDRKISDVEEIRRRIAAMDDRVTTARVTFEGTRLFKAFVDSGRFLTQDLSFGGATFAVFVSDANATRYAFGGNKLSGGYERLAGVASEEALEEAVTSALDGLRGETVPPGRHVLVTAPLVSATVAHEAFGHGVEMDMLAKDCSRAGEYMNRPVASAVVDMIDAPDLPNSAGFAFFDDEGELSRSTRIIENGILRGGLTDTYSAWKLGMPSTPNGRRESFRRKVYSRMTNTYFVPGPHSPEEILATVDHGIYLTGGGVGMEDPLGWGMQIDIRLGYEIRDGERTGRVFTPVGLTGFVPDLLGSITHVGNDLRTYGFGKCGKTFRKDWILVGMGGPTLRMEGRLA